MSLVGLAYQGETMNLKIWVGVLSPFILIGAVVSYHSWKERTEVDRLQQVVAEMMRDPEATRFRRVYVWNGALCGELNAKNGMGGYVGYQNFVYTNGKLTLEPSSAYSSDLEKLSQQMEAKLDFSRLRSQMCLPAVGESTASAASGT